MAIALIQIPIVPASPIPTKNSALTAFADDYVKAGTSIISVRERKTLEILGLIHQLNSVRAIDYRTNHKQLFQDAQVFVPGNNPITDMDTARAVLAWSNGQIADAALSSDLATLMAEGRDLKELAEDQLNGIIILLRAQLRQ